MVNDFFDSIDTRSQGWLNSLKADECCELQHWLKKRIKYLNSIPFIKKNIEELNLSSRAYNALKLQKLHTVEDIVHYGLDNIWTIRNIGSKTVIEIKEAVAH